MTCVLVIFMLVFMYVDTTLSINGIQLRIKSKKKNTMPPFFTIPIFAILCFMLFERLIKLQLILG